MNIKDSQCKSPDIFQEKINELFDGLEYIKPYIDDILSICKYNFEDYLNKDQTVLKELKAAGFKINAEKSCFGKAFYSTKTKSCTGWLYNHRMEIIIHCWNSQEAQNRSHRSTNNRINL